jgi:hypothetical protein
MTGREIMKAEAERFNALSAAKQREEVKRQQERRWLIRERDRAMVLPIPPSAASLPVVNKESPIGEEVRSGSQALEFSPLFAPLIDPGCF